MHLKIGMCPHCKTNIEVDRDEEYSICPVCGEKFKTIEAFPPKETPEEKSRRNRKFLSGLLGIALFVVCGYFLIDYIQKRNNNNNQNLIDTITKTKPDLSSSTTLTQIIITVTANDNYSEVQVGLDLCNDSDVVISTYTLIGTNYTKGLKYQLSHTLSVSELASCTKFKYRLISYK